MSGRPKILLAGLESWRSVARLPEALQRAGFEVGAASRRNSYLAATRYCDERFYWRSLRGGALVGSLETIARQWKPDLVVPADDPAAIFLGRLGEAANEAASGSLKELLGRSLGNPAAIGEATSKRRTLERARQLGIRVPAQHSVASPEEVQAACQRAGLPLVLKRSFGWGGSQVAICATPAEAVAAWRRLQRRRSLAGRWRAWRKWVLGRAPSRRWLPVDESIVASPFIPGTSAMCLAVVVQGEMLAALTALKQETFPGETGPSSVVRFMRNEEMRRVAAAMAGAWGLSGFVGFDFMVDAQGATWLIECNPRPTSIGHLGALAGEDLCAALYCRLTGRPPPRAGPRKELVVAHFPLEQMRDPESAYLREGYHDVPADDPALTRLMLEQCRPRGGGPAQRL